ncbi:MAG: carboxypeptidase regulatory-like domain-containing protein, partial [Sphingobacteriales bacterium]|nr:carboxypeptidase regulatory-like domain-containing protein [Sphingobacteriales bacterium]
MKKIITILFVFFANVTFLFAQESQIKGSIADLLDSTSLKGATISISTTDNAVLQTVVTSGNGSFEFGNLKKQPYLLKISNVGYKPNTINIDLEKENGTLGKIYLNRMVKEMETVTIVSTGAAVVQKDDTSQYNAKQYKVNPDATTEDMIKKMPGITVDKNGTITAQGEQVKKVTVDGKDFFGDDASAALKNIPAAAVDKIQVFDKMSDQAQMTGIDDGNSQKAINIITKAGINNAQFGRVYVGIGTEQTYAAGGNTSFFKGDRRISLVGNFNNINQQNFGSQDLLGITGNASSNRNGPPGSGNFRGPGAPVESFTNDQSSGISTTNAIGINYSDKWSESASITGSYFFNNSKNELISTTNNNKIGRAELKLDSSNMLFIIPSLNFQNNISSSSNDIKSYKNENDSLNNSNSGSLKLKDGYNLKNTIMYRHSFKKKNRIFSTSLNTTFTKNDGASKINGTYRFYDYLGLPIFPDSIQQQSTDNLSDGNTIGGSITYNEPLGKKGRGQFQVEYNPSVQTSKANQQT